MSIGSFDIRNIALGAVCILLLVVIALLLARLLRLRKQCVELRRELEKQKSRVVVRKEKIWELREKLRQLLVRLSEDERKLLNSYTKEEIGALYPEIIEALRQLLKVIEIGRLPKMKQADVMSAAIKLSHLLRSAFRVSEEPLLEDVQSLEPGEHDDSIRPRRVLIVDDNEESRRLSSEIVEGSGFLVDLATNGEEAVEKVRLSREGYYDMILMDIIMHGKNGYEATRDIRKLLRADSERIPVIALTANSFLEDYARLIDAGMNDRISKPISRNSFLSVVDKWLKRPEVKNSAADSAGTWFSIPTSGGAE